MSKYTKTVANTPAEERTGALKKLKTSIHNHTGFGYVKEPSLTMSIDATLASGYSAEVVALASQLKYQYEHDFTPSGDQTSRFNDQFYLDYAKRQLDSNFDSMYDKVLGGLDVVPDPAYSQYSYDEIIAMANSGVNIPKAVLAWAKAQQEADVIDYVVVNDDAEYNDEHSKDEDTGESDVNKIRAEVKDNAVKSKKAQEDITKNSEKTGELTKQASSIAKEQKNLFKNNSIDKTEQMAKEWKELDKKKNEEGKLSASDEAKYKKLGEKLSKNGEIIQDMKRKSVNLDSFLESIDALSDETAEGIITAQKTISSASSLADLDDRLNVFLKVHAYKIADRSSGMLEDTLSNLDDVQLAYVANKIGEDLDDLGNATTEDIHSDDTQEVVTFANDYVGKARHIENILGITDEEDEGDGKVNEDNFNGSNTLAHSMNKAFEENKDSANDNPFGFLFSFMSNPAVAATFTAATLLSSGLVLTESTALNAESVVLSALARKAKKEDENLQKASDENLDSYNKNNEKIAENNQKITELDNQEKQNAQAQNEPIVVSSEDEAQNAVEEQNNSKQNENSEIESQKSPLDAENGVLKGENDKLVELVQKPLDGTAKALTKTQRYLKRIEANNETIKADTKELEKLSGNTAQIAGEHMKSGMINLGICVGLFSAGASMLPVPATHPMGLFLIKTATMWDVIGTSQIAGSIVATAGAVTGVASAEVSKLQTSVTNAIAKEVAGSNKESQILITETAKAMDGLEVPEGVQNDSDEGTKPSENNPSETTPEEGEPSPAPSFAPEGVAEQEPSPAPTQGNNVTVPSPAPIAFAPAMTRAGVSSSQGEEETPLIVGAGVRKAPVIPPPKPEEPQNEEPENVLNPANNNEEENPLIVGAGVRRAPKAPQPQDSDEEGNDLGVDDDNEDNKITVENETEEVDAEEEETPVAGARGANFEDEDDQTVAEEDELTAPDAEKTEEEQDVEETGDTEVIDKTEETGKTEDPEDTEDTVSVEEPEKEQEITAEQDIEETDDTEAVEEPVETEEVVETEDVETETDEVETEDVETETDETETLDNDVTGEASEVEDAEPSPSRVRRAPASAPAPEDEEPSDEDLTVAEVENVQKQDVTVEEETQDVNTTEEEIPVAGTRSAVFEDEEDEITVPDEDVTVSDVEETEEANVEETEETEAVEELAETEEAEETEDVEIEDIEKETPDVETETEDVEKENPAVETETDEVETFDSDVTGESPEVEDAEPSPSRVRRAPVSAPAPEGEEHEGEVVTETTETQEPETPAVSDNDEPTVNPVDNDETSTVTDSEEETPALTRGVNIEDSEDEQQEVVVPSEEVTVANEVPEESENPEQLVRKAVAMGKQPYEMMSQNMPFTYISSGDSGSTEINTKSRIAKSGNSDNEKKQKETIEDTQKTMKTLYGVNADFTKVFVGAEVATAVGLGPTTFAMQLAVWGGIVAASVLDLLVKKLVVDKSSDIAEKEVQNASAAAKALDAKSKEIIASHEKNMAQAKTFSNDYLELNNQSVDYQFQMMADQAKLVEAGRMSPDDVVQFPDPFEGNKLALSAKVQGLSDKDAKMLNTVNGPMKSSEKIAKQSTKSNNDFQGLNEKLGDRNSNNNQVGDFIIADVAIAQGLIALTMAALAVLGMFTGPLLAAWALNLAKSAALAATGVAAKVVSNKVGDKIDGNNQSFSDNQKSLMQDDKTRTDVRKVIAKAGLDKMGNIPVQTQEPVSEQGSQESNAQNSEENDEDKQNGKNAVSNGNPSPVIRKSADVRTGFDNSSLNSELDINNPNDVKKADEYAKTYTRDVDEADEKEKAAASTNVSVQGDTNTKADVKLARFNRDGAINSTKRSKKVNAASASHNRRHRR